MFTHGFIPFNIKNSILSRRANLFFYVVVTSVVLTKENDETVGAFLRCVFASTLDIITLPKHMRGNTLYLLQQKYLMNMFIL